MYLCSPLPSWHAAMICPNQRRHIGHNNQRLISPDASTWFPWYNLTLTIGDSRTVWIYIFDAIMSTTHPTFQQQQNALCIQFRLFQCLLSYNSIYIISSIQSWLKVLRSVWQRFFAKTNQMMFQDQPSDVKQVWSTVGLALGKQRQIFKCPFCCTWLRYTLACTRIGCFQKISWSS